MPNKPGLLKATVVHCCNLYPYVSVRCIFGSPRCIPMSLDSSPSASTSGICLYCPACGNPFRAALPSAEPRLYHACGHTVCATCADAVAACPEPACPICAMPTVGGDVRDEALALAAEASFASLMAMDPAAAGPAPSRSKRGKIKHWGVMMQVLAW